MYNIVPIGLILIVILCDITKTNKKSFNFFICKTYLQTIA